MASGTRETTLRSEVIKIDGDFANESLNPIEYEFGSGKKRRIFRGRYQERGPYTTDE